ncbi:hypothetical protein HMPREF3033_00582 [Veillonellaceae bacterium DNF00751]|nr:hypothetical protein HMPREF3033_00582 [Veillonellaceae bacterium DNF00751]
MKQTYGKSDRKNLSFFINFFLHKEGIPIKIYILIRKEHDEYFGLSYR